VAGQGAAVFRTAVPKAGETIAGLMVIGYIISKTAFSLARIGVMPGWKARPAA
jgi:hypothetical protein